MNPSITSVNHRRVIANPMVFDPTTGVRLEEENIILMYDDKEMIPRMQHDELVEKYNKILAFVSDLQIENSALRMASSYQKRFDWDESRFKEFLMRRKRLWRFKKQMDKGGSVDITKTFLVSLLKDSSYLNDFCELEQMLMDHIEDNFEADTRYVEKGDQRAVSNG